LDKIDSAQSAGGPLADSVSSKDLIPNILSAVSWNRKKQEKQNGFGKSKAESRSRF
jgi:hypothetical protein